ncbi:MAG: CPBP family intramembrane glutamic endopeptidase [Bacteroidota bacterium]
MRLSLTKKQWLLLSPFIMVLSGHLVARITSSFMGKWAFIPVMLNLWLVAIFFTYLADGSNRIKDWLKPVKGKIGWKVMVMVVGLLPLPLFIMHWELLKPIEILVPYLLIAFINPFVEEFYWRGTLMDTASDWPKWGIILYSTFFFALNHPMSLGVFSNLNSGFSVFTSTFIMGIIWGVGYHKIGSLRWIIFSHFLVDTFNMSVPAFLDLFESGF